MRTVQYRQFWLHSYAKPCLGFLETIWLKTLPSAHSRAADVNKHSTQRSVRGAVFPAEERELTPSAEEMFELSVTAQTLSLADLYGGKLCAALDRQHPRDLFDVKLLLDNEGITEKIRKVFVVYLASHDRPMHELLDPTPKNIRRIFENEFAGMTVGAVSYEDLIAARDTLIETLKKELTNDEREFLVSLKARQPKWNSIGIEGVEKLPAVQWKLMNIKKISEKKQKELLEKLRRVLEM